MQRKKHTYILTAVLISMITAAAGTADAAVADAKATTADAKKTESQNSNIIISEIKEEVLKKIDGIAEKLMRKIKDQIIEQLVAINAQVDGMIVNETQGGHKDAAHPAPAAAVPANPGGKKP